MIETYDQAIAFIHGRHKWTKTPTFDRLALILATLDHPEQEQKYIHVTGTNGKGSTSQMMAGILRASGLQVGLFSSPFIERFNERIQDNAGQIPDDILLTLMQELAPLVEAQDAQHPGFELTEFEVVTTLMFMYFRLRPMDIVILEVGIGGMWDSTQFIPDKLASVITSVSYDHMHVLGDTLTEITTQKADIIQAERPVIVGLLPDEAMAVVTETVNERHSALLVNGQDFNMTQKVDGLHYTGLGHDVIVQLSLQGKYQINNAAVAITTVLTVAPTLGIDVANKIIQDGLSHVTWPARFETVQTNPLIIVDGAHNVAGIEALVETLRVNYADKHINVIFSALADKNFQQMLEKLLSENNIRVTVVPFVAPGARQAMSELPFEHERLAWQNSWQEALDMTVGDADVTIVTGSLYFVSEVRHAIMRANNN
ncbi:bifunctional folylpolyglutamate synthase/dihydrofolate synthase [Weissella ceti]|uniref:tetrahydrofolate synthase n=1 Tax=Weissella ceti TaxID=759620 RepID=A0ABT3E2E0_9LACO|nr:folylpolyglutamate synthase/dihydrofolate synthase family protein [Weissella ceti]MCW0952572.1 bifunctional folylpolyglutamate synthase/dihydrofolate synthase [Weissella ceti]QVK11764.1 bifunctional folylpolyglutamate synthase/dihydrofolate synthase [Weissella ceti]